MTQTEVLRAQGRWWREYAIAVTIDWSQWGDFEPFEVCFPLYSDISEHVYQGA